MRVPVDKFIEGNGTEFYILNPDQDGEPAGLFPVELTYPEEAEQE